jgi:3-oxoacyl-[acyl-carrier-protein] synthase-3
MPLSFFQNTFAGNPLDRASDRRAKPEWIAEQLAATHDAATTDTLTRIPNRATIQDALTEGRLKEGDLVLLASVGAGFTVGTALLRWAV